MNTYRVRLDSFTYYVQADSKEQAKTFAAREHKLNYPMTDDIPKILNQWKVKVSKID